MNSGGRLTKDQQKRLKVLYANDVFVATVQGGLQWDTIRFFMMVYNKTMVQLNTEEGLPRGTVAQTRHMRYLKADEAIAKTIRLPKAVIWPERYMKNGLPFKHYNSMTRERIAAYNSALSDCELCGDSGHAEYNKGTAPCHLCNGTLHPDLLHLPEGVRI